jgi:hypothetical protein
MDAHMLDNCTEFNSAFGLTDCHSDARSPESRLLGCTITACPDKVAAADPLSYIGPRRTPPFLILHGERDTIVPYHQSRLLYDKLAAAGDDARLISFPKAGHGTDFAMLTDDATREGAYQESTKKGHSTQPHPVTPTWQTVLSFLGQQPPCRPTDRPSPNGKGAGVVVPAVTASPVRRPPTVTRKRKSVSPSPYRLGPGRRPRPSPPRASNLRRPTRACRTDTAHEDRRDRAHVG